MAEAAEPEDLLTLEPLLAAVRAGVEGAGWELSGLQKTTSHQFEGRWEGESTRSAYVFFHRDGVPEGTSIDVYLDETSRGLKGNLALVLDGPPLGSLASVHDLVEGLGATRGEILPDEHRRPLTVRFRLRDAMSGADEAETEYRFKVHIPDAAISAGRSAVVAMVTRAVEAFERLLDDEDLRSATRAAGG